MGILFSDGFECPPNTAPDTFTAWFAKNNTPTIVAGGHYGSYMMQCDANQNYVHKNIGSVPSLNARMYMYMVDTPTVNLSSLYPLSIIGQTSKCGEISLVWYTATGWTIFINGWIGGAGGAFTYSLDQLDSVTIESGKWHCFEVKEFVDASVGTIEAWFNGTKVCSFTGDTTGQVSCQDIFVGITFEENWDPTVYFDDAVASTDYIGLQEPLAGVITGYATVM